MLQCAARPDTGGIVPLHDADASAFEILGRRIGVRKAIMTTIGTGESRPINSRTFDRFR